MINGIKSNQYINEKTKIDHEFFKKFLDRINEFQANKFIELEKFIEFSTNWDKSIERQELQLKYYNTRMIYFQNQDIVKSLKGIKYNNICINLNVDEIENELDIISE